MPLEKYPVDRELFERACELFEGHPKGLMGIGTLSEKNIHAILKYYFAPDPQYHEQKVGDFVADILMGGEITEIQTRSFNVLRRKLDCFLPNHEVTIVYPVIRENRIHKIDAGTGELISVRKSPVKGTLYTILPELYKIRPYLFDPHLHLVLAILDADDYRLVYEESAEKKKKRPLKLDRVPVDFIEEIHFDSVSDLMDLIPEDLPEPFSSKSLSKAVHAPIGEIRILLQILTEHGLIDKTGKEGNLILYTRKKPAFSD